jgi:hypothetical protein
MILLDYLSAALMLVAGASVCFLIANRARIGSEREPERTGS